LLANSFPILSAVISSSAEKKLDINAGLQFLTHKSQDLVSGFDLEKVSYVHQQYAGLMLLFSQIKSGNTTCRISFPNDKEAFCKHLKYKDVLSDKHSA